MLKRTLALLWAPFYLEALGVPNCLPLLASATTLARMETGLRILMADGPTLVEFSPHLSLRYYEELLGIVQAYTAGATSADLRDDLTRAVHRWGVTVTVTRASVPAA